MLEKYQGKTNSINTFFTLLFQSLKKLSIDPRKHVPVGIVLRYTTSKMVILKVLCCTEDISDMYAKQLAKMATSPPSIPIGRLAVYTTVFRFHVSIMELITTMKE